MDFALNAAQSVALVLAFLLKGYALQKYVPILKSNYVPAPFLGGLLLALSMLAVRPLLNITLDTTLVSIFATGFFASIGLRMNRAMIMQGLPKMALFLLLVVGVAVVQNILSLLTGTLLGIGPEEILLNGSLVFMGDATLAPLFQELGGSNDLLPALSAVSVLAVLVGTLAGGQVFKVLQKKADLSQTLKPPAPNFSSLELLRYLAVFSLSMALGFLPSQFGLGHWVSPLGGAFLAGLLIRLALDMSNMSKWMEVGLPSVNLLGNVSLSLFLTFMFATMQWQLLLQVGPFGVLMVVLNLVLLMLVTLYASQRIFGKSALTIYLAAGLPGFSIGIPASTMATLQCIKENHGALPLALFVVPPVGAWLITLLNPYIILFFF